MTPRVLATALCLLVATQAAAVASPRTVCKASGRVVDDCPCPPPAEEPQLAAQGCCEVVCATAAQAARSERAGNEVRAPDPVVDLTVPTAAPPPRAAHRALPALHDDPPGPEGPVWLRLRQLLR